MLGGTKGTSMSEQPPVQPPSTPPDQPGSRPQVNPANPANPVNPPTQPMTAAYSAPAAPSPAYPPRPNAWRQATATPGRRWALGLSAAAVVLLMVMGVAVTSLLVLRNHDRFSLVGDRQSARSFGQQGPGNGNGYGNGNGNGKSKGLRPDGGQNGRDMPGLPGGGARGLGGLGGLLGGTSLHGQVTANAAGSVQTLLFQRGEVTALSATSVTLKSSDGFTGTYVLNASTKDRGASLAQGQQAFVLARASDKVAITTLPMSAQAPTN